MFISDSWSFVLWILLLKEQLPKKDSLQQIKLYSGYFAYLFGNAFHKSTTSTHNKKVYCNKSVHSLEEEEQRDGHHSQGFHLDL